MEARTILLTSLVLSLWTSPTTGQDFCFDKDDGSYCQHCLQPVDCSAGVSTVVYPECSEGMACTVAFGASYCVPHTETDCACRAAGDQCDAYHPNYIEHCYASGPFQVALCPDTTPICVNGECVQHPPCTESDAWNLTPDCTALFYCDANSVIYDSITCEDGKYVNSAFECALPPIPACDGSCTGRCPNPVDCTKFFICDGANANGSGACPTGTFFDINTNECKADGTGGACTFLAGCDIEVGLGNPGTGGSTPSGEITTTPGTATTTTDGTTSTTTVGSTITKPPADTCDSSTVGDKYPSDTCSKQYYVCTELPNGQYGYVLTTCLGDWYFNTDPESPYCNVSTCP